MWGTTVDKSHKVPDGTARQSEREHAYQRRREVPGSAFKFHAKHLRGRDMNARRLCRGDCALSNRRGGFCQYKPEWTHTLRRATQTAARRVVCNLGTSTRRGLTPRHNNENEEEGPN